MDLTLCFPEVGRIHVPEFGCPKQLAYDEGASSLPYS